MEHGAFTRQQSHDAHQVTIVKQMPTMASSKQPTIAIITAQYCEKLAVDAMIENKETYVRYTTVGTYFFIVELTTGTTSMYFLLIGKTKKYTIPLQTHSFDE